jgi:hypothetical protein
MIFCNRTGDATGLNSLLAWDACLDVVGWEVESSEALRRIRQIQPQMIIVAHEETPLAPSPEVECLLKETSGITIVELGLHDRKICIYRGEESMLQQIEDLLKSIV